MLTTLETWYGARFNRLLETLDIHQLDFETAKLLDGKPHLLPFFFYRDRLQRFIVPGSDEDAEVAVRVNHGIWQTVCPSPICTNAQHASSGDRWFFCCVCCNSKFGGKSIRVVWPDSRDEIESALLARPWIATRNWVSGETVDGLLRENEVMG